MLKTKLGGVMNMTRWTGSCHCGNVRVEIGLTRAPGDYSPRACDCDFCRKHGASYLSDAGGSLTVRAQDEAKLVRYRQGSGTATFLFCASCGVLVGVVYEDAGKTFGSLNSRVMEGDPPLGASAPASPKKLAVGDRIERWKQLWFPDVRVEIRG